MWVCQQSTEGHTQQLHNPTSRRLLPKQTAANNRRKRMVESAARLPRGHRTGAFVLVARSFPSNSFPTLRDSLNKRRAQRVPPPYFCLVPLLEFPSRSSSGFDCRGRKLLLDAGPSLTDQTNPQPRHHGLVREDGENEAHQPPTPINQNEGCDVAPSAIEHN